MRTKKSIKNFLISTVLTTIIAIIGLFKSKIFLDFLGDEATGVYQLFSQLYAYISLVDAGLTSSLLYSLYKPISENNYSKINGILKSGRKFFNIIAIIILLIGVIVSFKIDYFMTGGTLSFTYIQICFILFILASSINYFVTARKILFEADQNIYNVHLIVYSFMIIKAIFEIILVMSGLKLFSLMILFLITSLLQNVFIYIVSKRKYKYLDYKGEPDNSFKKETKNLIFQKIGGIIFNNIDVVLISKFIGTSSIVIYTSYNYIINSLLNIIKKIGTSSLASVGNLLVTEKEKAKKIFLEYNALCFFIGSIICVPLLFAITPFIELFYGKEYILPTLGVICVVFICFLKIINMSLDVFITALGYFDKIKKCVFFESIVNLVLSIVLIFKFGISGVLLATVIAYLTGEFIIYPYVLNKYYFKEDKLKYYTQSLKLLLAPVVSSILIYFVTKNYVLTNLLQWFIFGVVIFIINLIFTICYCYIVKEQNFMNRFYNIFKELINKIKKKVKR